MRCSCGASCGPDGPCCACDGTAQASASSGTRQRRGCRDVMSVSSLLVRLAVTRVVADEQVFVELEAQADEGAFVGVLVAGQVRIATEADEVVADRQPQVLAQDAADFDAVGVLVG